jgi:small subunit ribosomal protein S6
MQKNYELLYIVHPDLEGTTDKVVEKVAGFITKNGGKITASEDWGKRKLAYPIAHNDLGVYELVNFELETTKLAEVERELRIAEEVMRSMIVAIPEISPVTAAKKKPRIAREAEEVVEETKEEPANIIVAEEKPKRAPRKKAEVTEKTPAKEVKEEKPKKAVTKKTTKKTEEVDEKAEAERLKKLDEKLDELLK